MFAQQDGLPQDPPVTALRQLPKKLPLILAGGLVLIPGSTFRLPIPGPEYLGLLSRMMKNHDFLGLIQPTTFSLENKDVKHSVELSRVGTVIKPMGIEKTDDDELSLLMRGVCRFAIKGHETDPADFILGHVSYQGFRDDLAASKEEERHFMRSFLTFFQESFEFSVVQERPKLNMNHPDFEPRSALTQLLMAFPFHPQERQAVLEGNSILDCYAVMGQIFKMSVFSDTTETIQ